MDEKKVNQPDDLVTNKKKPLRRVTRAYKAAGIWGFPPALYKFFVTAMWMLQDLVALRQVNLGSFATVTRVRVAKRKSESRVYIYPTDWDDPEGIEITGRKGDRRINMYDFAAEAGILLEPGTAYQFQVTFAGDDSPVGPALVFDHKDPKQTKAVKVKKSKET
jgi:hypothetical protein